LDHEVEERPRLYIRARSTSRCNGSTSGLGRTSAGWLITSCPAVYICLDQIYIWASESAIQGRMVTRK